MFARQSPGPDKYLADAALYATTAAGGRVQRLTTAAGEIHVVAAAPDSRRIAYTTQTYGFSDHWHVTGDQVHIMNADGSDNRVVYHCPASTCFSLEWSPVGDRLLVNGTTVVDPDGHFAQVCANACARGPLPSSASWSPDGKHLAVVVPVTLQLPEGASTVSAIGTTAAGGTHVHLITNRQCTVNSQSQCTYDNSPIWSPDGSEIAFMRLTPTFLRLDQSMGVNPGGRTGVVTVHPDGSQLLELHTCGDSCRVSTIQWSPRGERVAFVTSQNAFTGETTTSDVGFADAISLASGVVSVQMHVSQINQHWLSPAVTWAPSGTALAMVAQTPGQPAALYVLRFHGSRLSSPTLIRRDAQPPLTWLAAAAKPTATDNLHRKAGA